MLQCEAAHVNQHTDTQPHKTTRTMGGGAGQDRGKMTLSPPPQPAQERPFGCGALCPPPPPVCAGCSAATSAIRVGGTQGREALRASCGSSNYQGSAQGHGSRTRPQQQHHPCPWAVRECGSSPCSAACRHHSRAYRQSWSGPVACPPGVEVASRGQYLPRQVQRWAPLPPCRGLEQQAHTPRSH